MCYFSKEHYSIILPKVKAIHMFFVFRPLAIVVLNKEQAVLAKFIIKPWQISRYFFKAAYFLESTNVQLFRSVKIDDKLYFEEKCQKVAADDRQ